MGGRGGSASARHSQGLIVATVVATVWRVPQVWQGLRETIVEEWLASLFISLMVSVDVKRLLCDSHSMIIQMPMFF